MATQDVKITFSGPWLLLAKVLARVGFRGLAYRAAGKAMRRG